MSSLELIKNNYAAGNWNIPIYIDFNTIFSNKDYDNKLKIMKIKEGCLLK